MGRKSLLYSLPRLFIISCLWIVGSIPIVPISIELRKLWEADRQIVANIERRVPANPLEPDGWEGRLEWIRRGEFELTVYLALSFVTVFAGFALLYCWPRRLLKCAQSTTSS